MLIQVVTNDLSPGHLRTPGAKKKRKKEKDNT